MSNSVTLNSVAKTDAVDGDQVAVSGGNVTVTLGSVGAGGSGTVTYKVQIN